MNSNKLNGYGLAQPLVMLVAFLCFVGLPERGIAQDRLKTERALVEQAGVSRKAGASGHPELIVLSPRQGQTFDDTPIVVTLKVKNFKLVPPVPYFGKSGPQNMGHFHITLDSYPLVSTSATQIMLGKKAGGKYLSKGKHRLLVELAIDNHDCLTPPVEREITFYTTH